MNKQIDKFPELSKESFELVGADRVMHDQKLDTKPIGYFKDAFSRFAKNKGSVIAAIIIGILCIYAIVGPYCCNSSYTDAVRNLDSDLKSYKRMRPRLSFMVGTGIWDGSKEESINDRNYDRYRAMELERGRPIMTELIRENRTVDAFNVEKVSYTVRVDSYTKTKTIATTITDADYKAIQKWQDETGKQVILPAINLKTGIDVSQVADIWYKVKNDSTLAGYNKMIAIKDDDGNFIPNYKQTGDDEYTSKMRIASDPYNEGDTENAYRYATPAGASGSWTVRLDPYNYFLYKYDFEPSFIFGTDDKGYDIFSRLASGARFSLILAVCVSAINLIIGAFYGAIMGYYGGWIDIVLDRIAEILSGIPFMVVTSLFAMYLAAKVGPVWSIFFAFVMTGWIGMAYRVRMQFYRFKNQEYILAARTLGASDLRIMFKHIFPNSLGTIITGSILVIPGVIFSETSLTYLGIINLDSATRASVGSMLSNGQAIMRTDPHVVLFPAIFIGLLMVCFNLFGNGLRDAFNPSLRGVEE